MNILNNIWITISTPNEALVKIFCVLFLFIEAPLSFSLIDNVFVMNSTRNKKLIYILVTAFVAIISTLFLKFPINLILNYICALCILLFVFKAGKVKSLIAALFPSVIFNLIGNLLLNPYLTLLDITYEEANAVIIYRIPFSLLMYLTVFLLNVIIKHQKITITLSDNLDKKDKTIIVLNIIFGFLYILIQIFLLMNYINILPVTYTFFSFICLFTYFGLSYFSLSKVVNLILTTQKLESAEEYNKTLHILHDSVRGFKHDFDNIVTTIGGYINTNDMEGLKNYYLQLEEDCSRVNNLYILNPDNINNPGVYNLLTTKYNEAEEKGIKVTLTVLLDLNDLHMKIYEFARILGILLDNAIDAAAECDSKVLNIVFRNEAKNNRNIILIENTYKDKDVDIDQIFNKGVTGKDNHTGLGLWEVKQILKKNNNVNLYTTKNEQYFSQQLEIYY